ncbi:MAG TPA: lipocalin-like domain-containing protein [Gemmatimonadaceae bacterium]|nr:lipocalin-like domain-containing protein [Gemmatimonadaceae bacterium]
MSDVPISRPLSSALTGTWELTSRLDRTTDGEPRVEPSLGADPVALLIYDGHGHFSAQFMKRDRRGPEIVVAAAGPNNSRAQGGYDAYFGEYSVNDADGTVTQRLTGCLSPENVGQVLTRAMTVRGDELIIALDTATAAGEPVVRTLCWRRVG